MEIKGDLSEVSGIHAEWQKTGKLSATVSQ